MYIDLLIKIKNAQAVGRKLVKTRFTKMDKAVSDILVRRGYIASAETKGRPSKRFLFLDIRGKRGIEGVVFRSKPSVHIYAGHKEIRLVKGGHGDCVMSTPKGVLSGRDAKKEKVGGEVLFEIW